ncbi:hypothetical protein EV2_022785 [Malus domestica]
MMALNVAIVLSVQPPNRLAQQNSITIGEAREALAQTAGDRPIDQSDAAVIHIEFEIGKKKNKRKRAEKSHRRQVLEYNKTVKTETE